MKKGLFSLFILISCLSNAQNEKLKEQAYEIGKTVVKDQVTKALKDELGNQLGSMGGQAVGTIFNIIDKQAQKSKVRNLIEDANNQLVHLKISSDKREINRLRITPDSKYIVSAGEDKTVLITELSTGRVVKEIELELEVLDIKFHPTSNLMALAMSGVIEIWNLNTLENMVSLEIQGSEFGLSPSASLVYFHPTDSEKLIYFDPKKTFYCIDFTTNEEIYQGQIKTPSGALNALKYTSPTFAIAQAASRSDGFLKSWFPTADGNLVIQTRKKTYLWNPETESELTFYQKNKGTKDFVGIPYLIQDNGLYMSNDNELLILDAQNGNQLMKVPFPIAVTLGQAHERKILFSPDKEYFMVAGSQLIEGQEIVSLDFYQTNTLEKVISFPSDVQDSKEFYHYDWSQNGKYIVKYCASCKDKSVVVYDIENAEQTRTETPPEKIESVELNKYDELRELKKLLDEGILTQEEFEQQKMKVLNGNN